MIGYIGKNKKVHEWRHVAKKLSRYLEKEVHNSPVTEKVSHEVALEGKTYNLYFGDIHGHSDLSPDAFFFSPDHYYEYGRNKANLDFASLTDHDAPWGLREHPERWQENIEAGIKHYEPGRFVTFIGYEWTSGDGLVCFRHTMRRRDRWAYQKDPMHFGHRNIYFPSDNVPSEVFSIDDERYNTPEKLWEALKPYGAITIPHHTLGGPVFPFDWRYFNEEMEPVVEIYSRHGNSECEYGPHEIYNSYRNGKHSVKSPLDQGRHFGFIASSDCHQGRPGNHTFPFLLIEWLNFFYRGKSKPPGPGLCAVYAEELTRESLFESIKARRVYAVTGARIILDVRADDHFMGARFSAPAGKPVTFSISTVSSSPLERIEIIKNGTVVKTYNEPGLEFKADYRDDKRESDSDYIYIRVTRKDTHMAWSSPIRIDAE